MREPNRISEIRIEEPKHDDEEILEYLPGEAIQCSGQVAIKEGSMLLSSPKVSVLQNGVILNQRRIETPVGGRMHTVPFGGSIDCPTAPGEYAIQLSVTIGTKIDGEELPVQEVVKTDPIKFCVSEAAS